MPDLRNVKPILLDLPEEFETERLILRCARPGDGAEVNDAIRETIDDLSPWMPWATPVPEPETTEEWLRQQRAKFIDRSNFHFGMYLKSTGEFAGGAGLHVVSWDVPNLEIGYWCRKRYEGTGFISEAVVALRWFAFELLGANRVQIRIDPLNGRSRKVAERNGFKLEGELRNSDKAPDGRVRGTLFYSMLPEEYEAYRGTYPIKMEGGV